MVLRVRDDVRNYILQLGLQFIFKNGFVFDKHSDNDLKFSQVNTSFSICYLLVFFYDSPQYNH